MAAFLLLGTTSAYLLAALPVTAHHGLLPGAPPVERWGTGAGEVVAVTGTAGLLASALLVTWAGGGRRGVADLLRRSVQWRVGAWWWSLAVLALPALTVLLALLVGDSLRPVDLGRSIARQFGLLAVNLVAVSLWEEVAWSGFLQTRLQERFGLLPAALLTAVPFALVHLPLAFLGPFTAGSLLASFAAYLVLSAIVRPLLAVFLRGGGGSVLLVAVLHSSFNRANNADGFAAAVLQGGSWRLAAVLAPVLLTAVTAAAVRARPAQRSRSRRDLDAPPPALGTVSTNLGTTSAAPHRRPVTWSQHPVVNSPSTEETS